MGGKKMVTCFLCKFEFCFTWNFFVSQVFNRCFFGCIAVKATFCWKIVHRTETSGTPFVSASRISLWLEQFWSDQPFIYNLCCLMKIWGAGLCGWVGPVSPLEVLPGCKVYKTLRACLGMFLNIVSEKQFSRTVFKTVLLCFLEQKFV